MTLVGANHANRAITTDDFAVTTNLFNRCSYLHVDSSSVNSIFFKRQPFTNANLSCLNQATGARRILAFHVRASHLTSQGVTVAA